MNSVKFRVHVEGTHGRRGTSTWDTYGPEESKETIALKLRTPSSVVLILQDGQTLVIPEEESRNCWFIIEEGEEE
ncbi:MAG: hypothetical protein DRH08_06560 [Deltaproteobacteria bacterium]|nr:MAG: hypothetical protein DRH08_06560 [Deltaproteobacteria bacterium]